MPVASTSSPATRWQMRVGVGALLRVFEDASKLHLQRCGGMRMRLDPRNQTVERGDVAPDRMRAEGVRLDERRARTDERVVDAVSGLKASMEEELHELRNELAEVRMKAMDVLRARSLRKLGLRP